ncbi:preprotein translocase subunit SecE [Patescibacteria group bacterium]|nr:preprotein translocase subunit SecE [Patescibacteria group bacterium]MBU4482378.1 preprotein translocase subunit SecE [Patescibacteria group bacterium]
MLNKLINYIKASKRELKKVVWPSKKQTWNLTLLVMGFSLAVAAFLGAVDFGLNKIINIIL